MSRQEEILDLARQARIKLLNVAKRVGGSHIGGSFSILDFFVTYYYVLKNRSSNSLNIYYGKDEFLPLELLMSKGHCYLAQLCALDSVFGLNDYSENYMTRGSSFFGHPKKNNLNRNFLVSSGSLGQGICYGNGLAYGHKINDTNKKIISIIGDGEANEGSVTEALLFSRSKKLPHIVILDNNDQMSLGKTSQINSLGYITDRATSYGFKAISANGNNIDELLFVMDAILNISMSKLCNEGLFINLNTIKGFGVDFMEGDPKWHHRRFKGDEYNIAIQFLGSQT